MTLICDIYVAMPQFTQATRPVRIATSAGEDLLLVSSMTGEERLGRLFQYELVLLSEQHDLDYKKFIGQNVTIAVDKNDNEPRYFNGFLSRFAQTDGGSRLCEYRATLVPWLWFLTRSSDCRIFQNLTIPEILKEVFKQHGFPDVLFRLHGTYKPWEYCVQYRESAFDFVSRLMEQEGIYYFFKHQNGQHFLVLCDTSASHSEFKGYEQLRYAPGDLNTPLTETLWSWVEEHEVEPGSYWVKDFDFKRPRRDKISVASTERGHAGSHMEQFDYLGEMDDQSDGTRYSRLRLNRWQSRHETHSGEGDARGICTGVRFKLLGHFRNDLNKEYLTTGTEFHIHSAPFVSVSEPGDGFTYRAKLTAMPTDQEFRSPPVTPRPTIPGPQTAIVTGLPGEEIYTDKYGRVKVHFHWDRHAEANENSSCWIRVARTWAGKGWGAVQTPRVGQEVVVEFLDGDPDRPLITGSVFNEVQRPPYELPDHKTISSLKSNSTIGGYGFNEIRFEDKKGEEQIFIHGEKNLDVRIKNDAFETFGNDRHLVVKKDQFDHVENNRHEVVDADHIEQIGGDRHLNVEGKEAKEVGGSLSLTVNGDVIEVFNGNHSEQVSQNLYLNGLGVVIESATGLTLKCGASSVVIDSAGVTIKGATVVVDGAMVRIASGPGSPPASGQAGSAVAPADAKSAEEADMANPGEVESIKAQQRQAKTGKYGSARSKPHKKSRNDGDDAGKKKSWIEIELADKKGKPVPGEAYRVTLPDGQTVAEGTLDEKGFARVDGIDPGTCKVSFPKLEKQAWKPR